MFNSLHLIRYAKFFTLNSLQSILYTQFVMLNSLHSILYTQFFTLNSLCLILSRVDPNQMLCSLKAFLSGVTCQEKHKPYLILTDGVCAEHEFLVAAHLEHITRQVSADAALLLLHAHVHRANLAANRFRYDVVRFRVVRNLHGELTSVVI